MKSKFLLMLLFFFSINSYASHITLYANPLDKICNPNETLRTGFDIYEEQSIAVQFTTPSYKDNQKLKYAVSEITFWMSQKGAGLDDKERTLYTFISENPDYYIPNMPIMNAENNTPSSPIRNSHDSFKLEEDQQHFEVREYKIKYNQDVLLTPGRTYWIVLYSKAPAPDQGTEIPYGPVWAFPKMGDQVPECGLYNQTGYLASTDASKEWLINQAAHPAVKINAYPKLVK